MFEDLNQFVQFYKISKKGGIREFQNLQRRLSRVPISLNPFREYMKKMNCELSDLTTRAELFDPSVKIFLLDELMTDEDEIDSLTERMVVPYPFIYINGESVSSHLYDDTKKQLGSLILPDLEGNPKARVLSNPKVNVVAVVYEIENRVHYLEIGLTTEDL